MDPITVLNLAGNVAQFIDLGCKMYSMGSELYRSASGHLVEDAQLQSACESLELLTSQKVSTISIGAPTGQQVLSEAEQELLKIAGECQTLTKELQQVFAPLKVEEGKTENSHVSKTFARTSTSTIQKRLRVVRTVLRRLKKSGEIDQLSKRLDGLRSRLATCLLYLVHDEQSTTHVSLQAMAADQRNRQTHTMTEIQHLNAQNLEILQQLTSLQRATSSMAKTLSRTPPHHPRRLPRGDPGRSQAQAQAQAGLDKISSQLLAWIQQSEETAAHQRLLRSLHHPSLATRHAAIPDAQAHTFEWVFSAPPSSPNSSPNPPTTFPAWLAHPHPTAPFWIAGKPGSGKSTLMKFLHNHPQTAAGLRAWARSGDAHTKTDNTNDDNDENVPTIITAAFFFTKAGSSPLQRSPEGLLRALLSEVLLSARGELGARLARVAFPERWEEALIAGSATATAMWTWTREELLEGWRRVGRASGVFLWVHLVVNSLLDGLRNEDRLSDLERRLRLLPISLEEYFLHMWNNLGDAYQQQAARTLCVALAADRPLTLMTYSMLDEEEDGFSIKWEPRPMTQDELIHRHQVIQKRLNARCKDLLEVKACWTGKQTFPPRSQRSPENEASAREFFAYRVELLHRTVVEFLTSDEMQERLRAQLPADFNPWKQLCHAYLGQIKRVSTTPRNVFHNGPMSSLVEDLVDCVRKIATGPEHRQEHIQLMLELRKVMGECEDETATKASVLLLPALGAEQNSTGSLELDFLVYCVRKGLIVFVQDQLQHEFRSITPQDCSLLIRASLHLSESSSSTGIPDPAMLLLLLEHVDPSQRTSLQAIWNEFLSEAASRWEEYLISTRIVTSQIINILLDAGLDGVEPGTSQILPWPDVLLMSRSNWTSGSERLCELICSAIDKLLSRGTDVNAVYKDGTLWEHFVGNMADRSIDVQIRRRLHGSLRVFVERGADSKIRWRRDGIGAACQGEVVELLLKVYSDAELAQIGLCRENRSARGAGRLGDSEPRKSGGFGLAGSMWSAWSTWFGPHAA
ncbi:small s protein [Diplodia corticola]|uniref:Small s protein n=1 Tax=Diplodia corticola TaxID=236234 RepID=A0A1J9SF86_9PEZI|nr:small s protein [Diplodia corticola]OJD39079.1 small s protein [Diplodia corticola]